MNILIANDTCEADGGSAGMALTDAKMLATRGHKVIFFSACGTPPKDQPEIEWISLGQKNILNEPRRWLAISRGLWNWTVVSRLSRILKRFSPLDTVVHLHSWSKALTGSVVWSASRAGFKIVSTQHDYFIVCPNGSFYDYPGRHACVLRPMSGACVSHNCDSRSYPHKVWRVLRQWIWRLSGVPARLSQIIAVSDFSYKKLQPLLAAADLEILENVTDVLPYKPSTHARTGVAYAGRISAEKGVDLYLQACVLSGIRGEVWGDGPLLPELKRRWPNAHYRGWLGRNEMHERLSQLLILVVPTYLYETYGLIVAEAAAAGVAVIVSDGCAAADLVEDGVTGLLFRSADAEDLSAKLKMLSNDPIKATEMGRVAAERFWRARELECDKRFARLEVLYHQQLSAE